MSQPCLSSDQQHRRQRNAVWIGLSLAIVMVTVSQLCWKGATLSAPQGAPIAQVLLVTFRQPVFLLAIGLYALQFFNWMWVLSNADLSYAQPITALSYVSVSLLACPLFKERLSPWRLAGVALILAGVWFISRTGHRTRPHVAASAPPQAVPSPEDAEVPAIAGVSQRNGGR